MNTTTKHQKGTTPIITAVDLGTSKIVVIIASLTPEGRFEIRGIGESESLGVENGVVKDIPKASEAIKKAIEIAEEAASFTADNLFVSVSGKFIKSVKADSGIISISELNNLDSCRVTQEHIDKITNSAVENVLTQESDKNLEVIHSIPISYKLDGQEEVIHNPKEMSASELQGFVHVVLANKNYIKNIRRCFELNDYEIRQIVFSALANVESVLSEDEKKLGCFLIDIGAGTLDYVFFFQKLIFLSAVNSGGGDDITYDISREIPTIIKEAERIKVSYGNAQKSEATEEDQETEESEEAQEAEEIKLTSTDGERPIKITQQLLGDIINNRLSAMLSDIAQIIELNDYYKYLDAGIVITGGTAMLKNIDSLCEEIFNKQVRVGKPNLDMINKHAKDLSNPKYATVVGLLYYAKGSVHSQEELSISIGSSDADSNLLIKILKSIKKIIADFF